MSRWLAAARAALTPPDKTDKSDKTPDEALLRPGSALSAPVLSEMSVLSEGEDALGPSPRMAIIEALRRDAKTPGAVATAARLGVTLTYQTLDRMAAEGLVSAKPDGAVVLAGQAMKPPPDLPKM